MNQRVQMKIDDDDNKMNLGENFARSAHNTLIRRSWSMNVYTDCGINENFWLISSHPVSW